MFDKNIERKISGASTNSDPKGTLRSETYDDVYFSEDDGLAEARHVFIEGNNLPNAWKGKQRFVIAETGFGTGLNFLAAWKLFEETTEAWQKLNFISFERHQLDIEEITTILYPWADEIWPWVERLQPHYPMLVPGFHRLRLSERVNITLIFEDVNAAIPLLDAEVDAWFLDGFKPSSNPDMWTGTVFHNMARLSAPGATFATFTAAGGVRRGLESFGFDVQKVSGFGRKRDMLIGAKI